MRVKVACQRSIAVPAGLENGLPACSFELLFRRMAHVQTRHRSRGRPRYKTAGTAILPLDAQALRG
jgi:hypothetical protein